MLVDAPSSRRPRVCAAINLALKLALLTLVLDALIVSIVCQTFFRKCLLTPFFLVEMEMFNIRTNRYQLCSWYRFVGFLAYVCVLLKTCRAQEVAAGNSTLPRNSTKDSVPYFHGRSCRKCSFFTSLNIYLTIEQDLLSSLAARCVLSSLAALQRDFDLISQS